MKQQLKGFKLVCYHFLRDHVQKGDIVLEFTSTHDQLADIFTIPLPEDRLCMIRRKIGMMHVFFHYLNALQKLESFSLIIQMLLFFIEHHVIFV